MGLLGKTKTFQLLFSDSVAAVFFWNANTFPVSLVTQTGRLQYLLCIVNVGGAIMP